MQPQRNLLVCVVAWILFWCHFGLLRGASAQDNGKTAAETEVARGENYLVYACRKTELQDYLLGSSSKHRRDELKACILVDGQSLFTPQGLLDPSRMDWDKLSTEIRNLRVDERSVAMFHALDCGPGDFRVLNWLFVGFGRSSCGFNHVYWRSSSHQGDFWERIQLSEGLAHPEITRDETPVGNELVQVYPVRTFLSRFNSDNADCVVRIVPQLIRQQHVELRGAIRTSMQTFVPMIEVANKKKLLVLANYHKDARATVDWLREEGFAELADKLGYGEVTGQFAEYAVLLKNDN